MRLLRGDERVQLIHGSESVDEEKRLRKQAKNRRMWICTLGTAAVFVAVAIIFAPMGGDPWGSAGYLTPIGLVVGAVIGTIINSMGS